jgi:hypothetical protein
MSGYYNQRVFETKMGIGPTDIPQYDWLMANNGDLFLIDRNDPAPPASTSVHILTVESNYQQKGFEGKIGYGPTVVRDTIGCWQTTTIWF